VNLKHLPSFNVAVARLLRSDAALAPAVMDFCHKFLTADSVEGMPGLSIEKIADAKSRDVWSARVSQDLRAILRKRGPSWYAAYLGHHDAAYGWARRTAINLPKTPAAVGDELADDFDAFMAAAEQASDEGGGSCKKSDRAPMLFDPFDDRSLEELGVPHAMIPMLRAIATIEEYIDKTYQCLPEGLGDRLFAALSGDFATVTEGLEDPDPPATPEDKLPKQTPAVTDDIKLLADHPNATWAALPDAQQIEIAEGRFKGAVLVTGPAGSGKTAVAIHRARFLARQGKRVLLTTYTKSLQNFLQYQLNQICGGEARLLVDVYTLDHVAIEMSGYQDTLFDKEFLERDDFQRTCIEATQQISKGRAEVPYDAIIVDEAQDMDPVRVAFIQALSRKCRKSVMLLGDMRQRLYSEPFDFEDRGFDIATRVFHLDTVYRSTAQIAALGEAIMATAEPGDYAPAAGACTVYADGPAPEYVGLSNDADELVWLAIALLDAVQRRGALYGLAVLARRNQRVSEVKDILHAVGLGAKDGIRVSSMHSAKGLEFAEVYVLGVSADRMPNPWAAEHRKKEGVYGVWLEQERNLLHVAATRASERVVVSWAGQPSPFLDKALEGVAPARGWAADAFPDVRLATSELEEDPAGLRRMANGAEINAQQIAGFLRPFAEELVVKGRMR